MSDVLFARRGIVPVVGQREKWLGSRRSERARNEQFVAVGSGRNFELPPLTDRRTGPEPARGRLPPTPLPRPALGPGPLSTPAGSTFDLGKLDLATAMLRCDYVARNRIMAVRLDGKASRAPGRRGRAGHGRPRGG